MVAGGKLRWSLGFVVASLIAAQPAPAADDSNADWPCVQHKVPKLTAAQIWDGPDVEGLTGWQQDAEINKLVPILVSRRVPVEEAAAAIGRFAEAAPAEKRNAALTLLFAAVLDNMNNDRSIVMSGIERFQQRQRARAAEIERQGEVLRDLKVRAAGDEKARAELAAAEERYNWDVRVFTERQQSLPLACEVPVLIEQRLFELAREIRSHMSD